MAEREPVAERPTMPGYGIAAEPNGLLPWSWATQRLRESHGYWIATTNADGTPHLAVVWAVWFEDAVCFSTGGNSRKARNLAHDPRCAVTPGNAAESLVVHGSARRLTDAATLTRLRKVYRAKYGEAFPDPAQNPVFAVTPMSAFGIVEAEFTTSATRWVFVD